MAGQPVAFLVLSRILDETHVLNIAVAPARQRQGLARTLLENAIVAAQRDAMSVIYLEVRESNHSARALYQSLDFTVSGTRKIITAGGMATKMRYSCSACWPRGINKQLRATSYELRATSYELRATSYELRATSYELRKIDRERWRSSQASTFLRSRCRDEARPLRSAVRDVRFQKVLRLDSHPCRLAMLGSSLKRGYYSRANCGVRPPVFLFNFSL